MNTAAQEFCNNCNLYSTCGYVIRKLECECPNLDTYMQGYDDAIECASKWIEDNAHQYIHQFTYKGTKMYGLHTSMLEKLRKHLEE